MAKTVDELYLEYLMEIIEHVGEMANLGLRKDLKAETKTSEEELFAKAQSLVSSMDKLCREYGLIPVFTGDINSHEDVNRYCRELVKDKFDNRKL